MFLKNKEKLLRFLNNSNIYIAFTNLKKQLMTYNLSKKFKVNKKDI